jgi:mRNA interferase RelE/StbE
VGKLADDPRPVGYRKLVGRGGAYRIRVGSYRIIYTVNDGRREVDVGMVDDRKDVY